MCHMHAVRSQLSIRGGEQDPSPGKISNLVPSGLATSPARSTNECTQHTVLRQDASFMKTAAKLAEFNVRVGHWNKGTMTAYLRTCTVPQHVIENVLRVGKIESG